MRIVATKKDLAAALASVGRIASAKATMPVLSMVRLTAAETGVELAATDMELSIRLPVEASVEESGSVLLPRVASDIVRSLADGPVTIEHRAGEGVATLSGGNSSFTLNCLQAADYPELPDVSSAESEIPSEEFLATAERVAKAASRDEMRPVLTGVLLRLAGTEAVMVATDSYRLAVDRAAVPDQGESVTEAIVPARALAELARLADGEGALRVALADNQASFALGDTRLTSRLIDGQFPDYNQLIPDEFDHDLVLDRAELLGVLGRIGILAQRGTPVRLAFETGTLTVSATQSELGEGSESIPVAFEGEAFEVGFNVEFLRAGVESLDGEEVRLGLISPLRPGLLRGEGDDYRYLLMPIRLNT